MGSVVRVMPLLAAMAVFVQACGGEETAAPIVPPSATTTAAQAPLATPSGPEVRSARLLSETEGWALTDQHLAWTDDGGATWNDITPDGISTDAIWGVFFLDAQHGWLVAAGGADASGAIALRALRTEDGGRTWLIADLGAPTPTYQGGTAIDFVDERNGWVMARGVSGSSFSVGSLFRTADGGATWRKLPRPPLGNPVLFVNASDGWIAGGPAGDRLFVTRDGGETWEPVQVVLPAESRSNRPGFALPVFRNSQDGVLPVTFPSEPATTISFYETHDGGVSWSLASSLRMQRGGSGGAVAVLDSDSWVVGSSVSAISSTDDGGRHWTSSSPEAVPANFGGIIELHFANGTTGWARTFFGVCLKFKEDCFSRDELFATRDGGRTWTQLFP